MPGFFSKAVIAIGVLDPCGQLPLAGALRLPKENTTAQRLMEDTNYKFMMKNARGRELPMPMDYLEGYHTRYVDGEKVSYSGLVTSCFIMPQVLAEHISEKSRSMDSFKHAIRFVRESTDIHQEMPGIAMRKRVHQPGNLIATHPAWIPGLAAQKKLLLEPSHLVRGKERKRLDSDFRDFEKICVETFNCGFFCESGQNTCVQRLSSWNDVPDLLQRAAKDEDFRNKVTIAWRPFLKEFIQSKTRDQACATCKLLRGTHGASCASTDLVTSGFMPPFGPFMPKKGIVHDHTVEKMKALKESSLTPKTEAP